MEASSDSGVLDTREFDLENDYEIISRWWLAHGAFVPHEHHLPKTGIMVQYNKGYKIQISTNIQIFVYL